MADVEADLPPQRKRKVEASGSSAYAPKQNCRHSYDWWELFDAVDPDEEEEYYRQIYESDGFDLDFGMEFGPVIPRKCSGTSEDSATDILFGRVGLHCYNIQKGTNLMFKRLEKYNIRFISDCYYYITLEALDPASGSLHTFQTCFADGLVGNKWQWRAETEICRLKPATPNPGFGICGIWDDEAVDDFYKGDMPNWHSDDALTIGDKLYKVQDSDLDLARNDCLHLYCEVALYSRVKYGPCSKEIYKSFMPLEMKQVYVQTLENVKPVWKARNAIFYISFRTSGCAVERKAIVRKTMDGNVGHLRLETKLLPM